MNKFFQNDDFQLDEILFNGRNKQYGAYALRHDANKILTRAMFAGIAFIAVVSVTPFIINRLTPKAVTNERFGNHILVDLVDPPQIVPPKPEPVQTQQTQQKTIDTSVPTPVHHVTTIEKPAVKPSDYDGAVPGLTNTDGEVPTQSINPPVIPTVGSGPTTITPDPPVVKPKTNDPIIKPDAEAKFDGGINAFRDKFLNKFDGSTFDGSGETLRTTLTFIVEKDGTISGIKANGKDVDFNSEALRAIKSVKGKWTPAQLDGENVRSYFTFPVSMKFE